MMRRIFALMAVFLAFSLTATHAQDSCTNALPTRLQVGSQGKVSHSDGKPLNVRADPSLTAKVIGQLPEGTVFDTVDGPTCADYFAWWKIKANGITGWAAEGDGDTGTYFLEPVDANATQSSDTTPIGSTAVPTIGQSSTQSGKLPILPIDLTNILFLKVTQLNSDQQALLGKNGFVVVPGGFNQFDEVYSSYPEVLDPPNGDPSDGKTLGQPNFVTTDIMLHSLHYIFDNMLTDLEKDAFAPRIESVISASLDTAQKQLQQLTSTPLETPAKNAVLYLAVAQELFAPGQLNSSLGKDIVDEAQKLAKLATDASGQANIDFLGQYTEDFSQYRPRGHYAGDPSLEAYFRGMMWISRITFLANDAQATQTALLVLEALHKSKDVFKQWQTIHDLLNYLIGPVDDLGPIEYVALATQVFGDDPKAFADSTRLQAFQDAVAKLPGPQINGLPNPGTTTDVSDKTKGFRFLGQRFTLDGMILQQLIYPAVGTRDKPRLLPLALDVASVMGSDTAYNLAQKAGASDYANYNTQTKSLRDQISKLTQDQWLQNTYSGWLWSLQPLLKRDTKPYPPLIQTNAWLFKDINTALASWTELKHDTVLYAKQPTGFGGGGPPLFSYGYVEANPLVFERLSMVASLTLKGLKAQISEDDQTDALKTDFGTLSDFADQCKIFAGVANKELAGQPITNDEYFSIELVGEYEDTLLRTLHQSDDPLKPVALVTDVASNPSVGQVLQEGVGGVDVIYVVIPGPRGLQLAKGAVFSYYEFVGDINKRMTDDEWRALVNNRQLPPRPDWVKTYLSGPEPPVATPGS